MPEDDKRKPGQNRYVQIVSKVFQLRYKGGATEVRFEREDLNRAADELGLARVKNLGDVVSSFKFRQELPRSIQRTAAPGREWRLETVGRASYRFAQVRPFAIAPNPHLAETKVFDATPAIVSRFAQGDEQAVLAKLRYNRLVDTFTGVTCYSLQNHLRTTVSGIGQIETDELYVGVDKRGILYIFPVQAKGGRDSLGAQQIEQDLAMCGEKFPSLVCRPIAAQLMGEEKVALFELEGGAEGLKIVAERHYRLVPEDDLSSSELEAYRKRPD
jgi:hypothetical protein